MSETPNFDEMSPKEVRAWGNELAWQASQFGEIKATLIVNCREGRALHKLGITYSENNSVIHNLVGILGTLMNKIEKKEKEKDI